MGTFLFSGEEVFKKIKVLSGGEKGRLQLCIILKKGPNLLLLDEPTNHMDIVGKESLENILKEYKGTLIFVSHDRYFVNKIADSILEFEKDNVTYFNGSYEEYMEFKENRVSNNIEEREKKKNTFPEQETKIENDYFKNKEINKIKNKISKLEREIEEKEKEVKIIEEEMLKDDYNSDYMKLKELEEKIQTINNEINEKMEEWERLNNKIEEN